MIGPSGLHIRDLSRDEFRTAAALVARGMRDNPLHIRAFGRHPDRRQALLAKFFRPILPQFQSKGCMLGAFHAGVLVGVLGMVMPGRCQPRLGETLRILPSLIWGSSPAIVLRVKRWMDEWGTRDLRELHWHLGPVAVDAPVQGKGIGSVLLSDFCRRMDELGTVAYLETDKPTNVRFYEQFGFVTVGSGQVLGIPNWFMRRPVISTSA